MIINKLDIGFLIKSISELEKLKLLLFDEDQYYLFEKIPKPYIVDARNNLIRNNKFDSSSNNSNQPDEEDVKSKAMNRSPSRLKNKTVTLDENLFDPVFISSSTFWNKSKMTNDHEMEKFSKALDNIRAKEEKGNLNPIDKRLMKILKLYRKDQEDFDNDA